VGNECTLESFRLEVEAAFQFLLEKSFKVKCRDDKENLFFSPFYDISFTDQVGKREVGATYARVKRQQALRRENVGVIIFATDQGDSGLAVDDYVISKHPNDEPKLSLDPSIESFRERIRPVLHYYAHLLSTELRSVVEGREWIEGYGAYME